MKQQKIAINKIVRDSYPNLIIDQVLNAIKEGVIKPGDELPSENDLIQQFGVGRTSVREALAGLEYLDIIILDGGKFLINPNTQSFFNKKLLYHHKIDKHQYEKLVEVREILEIEFVKLAVIRATEIDIKHLNQIVRALGNLIENLENTDMEMSEKEKEDYIKIYFHYHMTLAKSTQNTIYGTIYEIFKEMIYMDVKNIVNKEFVFTTYKLFKEIVLSIQYKDIERSTKYMSELIQFIKDAHRKFEECAEEGFYV